MDRAEFEAMEMDAQLALLNGMLADGKDMAAIEAEIGMSQRDLIGFGFYKVRDKFMAKPMRGYQTARRSGNEYAETGGGWRNESEITDENSVTHTALS